jgi:hypothetical protein
MCLKNQLMIEVLKQSDLRAMNFLMVKPYLCRERDSL